MFLCPVCGIAFVPMLSQLMTHIRLIHADDPHFVIQFNLQGCKRTFGKFTVYRNHVYAYHDTSSFFQNASSGAINSGADPDPVPAVLTSCDSEDEMPESTSVPPGKDHTLTVIVMHCVVALDSATSMSLISEHELKTAAAK